MIDTKCSPASKDQTIINYQNLTIYIHPLAASHAQILVYLFSKKKILVYFKAHRRMKHVRAPTKRETSILNSSVYLNFKNDKRWGGKYSADFSILENIRDKRL